MDDKLKRLMQDLGSAINETLSDSETIAAAIGEIRQAGYDVFLVLEATIGFSKQENRQEEAEPRPLTEKVTFTSQDQDFLKSMKIQAAE